MQWARVQPHSSDDNFSLINALADAFQSQPIALVALTIAGIVGFFGWQHNRHSVQPIMRFRVHTELDPFSFELRLHNVGLGPAIIIKWSIYKDGKIIELPRLESEWKSLLKSIGITGCQFGYGNIVVDETLAPRNDDSQLVLEISDLPSYLSQDVRPELNRLNFICKYKSVHRFSGQTEEFHTPEAYRRIVQEWKKHQASAPGDAANADPTG